MKWHLSSKSLDLDLKIQSDQVQIITLIAVSQGFVQKCPLGPAMLLGAFSLRHSNARLSLLDHGQSII